MIEKPATYQPQVAEEPVDLRTADERASMDSGSDSSASEAVPYYGPDDERLHELARVVTQSSLGSRNEPVNVFGATDLEPRLDPNSPDFNSRAWARNLNRIYDADPDRYPSSRLGLSFRNLSAHGVGQDANFQKTVGNSPLAGIKNILNSLSRHQDGNRVDILQPMDGVVNPGEMLVVLGRPGSGCSTFLRTMAAQTHGFQLGEKSEINYMGLSPKEIATHYRGDATYCAESELHFPQMTVGDTLQFAARMKVPGNLIPGVSAEEYATHMRDMIMATYGLSHTVNTLVGNDLIRGVSGGERKRVSIAELALCESRIQCWDNSTRGLDSATALEFIRSLRAGAEIFDYTALVAVYQASEEMYNMFNKVIVLYEGYQIFFGPVHKAREFFYNMGWQPKPRQPTPDFLTSLSQASERECREGFEDRVPRTAVEFHERWINSPEHAQLLKEVEMFNQKYPVGGEAAQEFRDGYRARQAKSLPASSPFMVSYNAQIRNLCIRGWQRLKGDPTMPLTTILGNSIQGLFVASMYYNMSGNTNSFYGRTSLIFFAVLFSALISLLEIFALYQARPIVQKHHQYALYNPAIDAVASILTEMPVKAITAIFFNLAIYFIANLRREPGNFFFYLLVSFMTTLCGSHIFRTIGAATRTFEEAMIPANILLVGLFLFTGFVIPTRNMHKWCRWINYIDPLAYTYEALLANEFHNREYECSSYIPTGPGYENVSGDNRVCSTSGALAGQTSILGDNYINSAYRYKWSHAWRNFGVLTGFTIFFLGTYMLLVWVNPGARTKGEVLVYPRSVLNKLIRRQKHLEAATDNESGAKGHVPIEEALSEGSDATGAEDKLIESSDDIFYWKDLCYDIKIKGEDRRLLNYVDGWVKPGTLTALMGASGAGKTTLLDTLANRVTMGVVTGHIYVNGIPRDNSFQRTTGYAMQQDIHLSTSTVRESLTFSALLRQPYSVPREEKIRYVDNVLKILEMEPYADAVVGVPGEGLNVEQRKRLTIGVELAAKPKLLLFLDEPTSGLDSQTSWSICQLLKKLSKAGQAILCTIHQPSALLLQQFDRLLFLAKGGRTVYFGDIGENAKTLTGYFEKYGAEPCGPEANPAEWMLHVIGAAPGSHANRDYADTWLRSEERQAVRSELNSLMKQFNASESNKNEEPGAQAEFASPLWYQYYLVSKRTFEQNWRSPLRIYSKIGLSIFSALFNGFTFFKADNSLQGMQNLMFAIFMFTPILISSIQQYLPSFIAQRSQFEARERPSKMFDWKSFIFAQITAEIPWQVLTAVFAFLCWYYPVGLYNNAANNDAVTERSGLVFFYMMTFYIYAITLGQLVAAPMADADSASNIATLLYSMCLLFCGVLVTKDALPGFWKFMYRVSPMTYYIGGMLATAIGRSPVVCRDYELSTMQPLSGQTCQQYLQSYVNTFGGYVNNPDATSNCQICSLSTTDSFLQSIFAPYEYRWRNYLIFMCYIFINLIGCVFLYWLARVPKSSSRMQSKEVRDLDEDLAVKEADAALAQGGLEKSHTRNTLTSMVYRTTSRISHASHPHSHSHHSHKAHSQHSHSRPNSRPQSTHSGNV